MTSRDDYVRISGHLVPVGDVPSAEEAAPSVDVDRYITDEATADARRILYNSRTTGGFIEGLDITATVLRATLPGILAAHRADVLREAAARFTGPDELVEHQVGDMLHRMADEAVADD